jgi:signal transduction protein with GAF and PtsI domain
MATPATSLFRKMILPNANLNWPARRRDAYTDAVKELSAPKDFSAADAFLDIDFLHELGKRISAAPISESLGKVVRFVSTFVKCDSCFVYILDGKELVLRASRNPHSEALGNLRIPVGEGITGWVAENKKPVAIARKAFQDSRFRAFNDLPEDRFEAFLSVPVMCREKLVGVINVQHKQAHFHSRRDIQLISVIGYLIGAEIEMARLEAENIKLSKGAASARGIFNSR